MLRVISKDGKISNGVEVLKVVGKHKSVILDSCEGRNMQIYLPPSYNSSDKRYPVAYIHDGQNLFVKSTAPVNGYWKVYDTMEELIKTGKVEEMIVVGIYNSSNRTEEYVPYDSEEALNGSKSIAKDYAAFVVKKIIPYVDGKYRTIPNRENRAVMGSSYGGIFSMWMIQNYNEIFSMAAPMSPSLNVGNGEIGREILKEDKKSMKLWLDMGSLEWSRMSLFLEILAKKGYEYEKDFVFLEGYGDMHNEPAWAKRISNAFIMFKGKEAKEIKNIKFDIEAVRGWYGDKWDNPKWEEGNYFVLNPVVEMDNGMKYSLNRFAKYELLNKDDGTIDVEGVFTFKSNKNLEVKVSYKNIEEKVVINYEEMQKKMKEIKE